MQFVESDTADNNLGTQFRKARPGPELDLVESFLKKIPLIIPKGYRVTVFREPRIESGFPDIVVVVWQEEITHDWRSERRSLNSCDLRLMHFLHNSKKAQQENLLTLFSKRVVHSIGRLHDAGMIYQDGSTWCPFELRQSFAATKIIAIPI